MYQIKRKLKAQFQFWENQQLSLRTICDQLWENGPFGTSCLLSMHRVYYLNVQLECYLQIVVSICTSLYPITTNTCRVNPLHIIYCMVHNNVEATYYNANYYFYTINKCSCECTCSRQLQCTCTYSFSHKHRGILQL